MAGVVIAIEFTEVELDRLEWAKVTKSLWFIIPRNIYEMI